MKFFNTQAKLILLFTLTALLLLRVFAALNLGATVDEAHYIIYGLRIDWSYFDHPPLVGWTHAIFQKLPFTTLFNARLPALIISCLSSWMMFRFLKSKNFSETNSLLAVLLLNLTPMFNVMSIALLPDTLLMPLTLACIMQTEKLTSKLSLGNWLKLGCILGLAALSKYTSIVFVVALIVVFVNLHLWKQLLKPGLWLGAMLSLIFILPVLYWNWLHEFASFKYQSAHVSTMDSSVVLNLSSSFAIQLLSWGIGPFIIALAYNFRWLSIFNQLLNKKIFVIFATTLLAFFGYVAISETLLPHWMLPYFFVMVPVSFAQVLEKKVLLPWSLAAAAISAILSLSLLFETAFGVFPADKTAKLYEGVKGWEEAVEKANQYLDSLPGDKKSLAVLNWTLGSRAIFYNKSPNEVFVLDQRYDQFDIWNPQSPIGRDFVVLLEKSKRDEQLSRIVCGELALIGEKITTIKDIPVNHFLYYHCANLIEVKP